MSERVVELDGSPRWGPDVPDAVLLCQDARAVLAVNAHFDDEDQRAVVLTWTGVRSATMGQPNDEARGGHRLAGSGLLQVSWVGLVENSDLVAALEAQNAVHPRHRSSDYATLRHFVLPLKECTVEVVATHLHVTRSAGPPVRAVTGA